MMTTEKKKTMEPVSQQRHHVHGRAFPWRLGRALLRVKIGPSPKDMQAWACDVSDSVRSSPMSTVTATPSTHVSVNISDLPLEIVLCIFRHLDGEELAALY